METGAIAHATEECLTVDELRASIGSFSQADMLRLYKAARVYCGGSGFEAADLRQEAFVRAFAGTRQCPRNLPVLVFLVGVMRSIVSAGRASVALDPEIRSLAATGTDGRAIDPPSIQRTAEDLRLARDDSAARLATLEEMFADDEEAQMVILADIDGLDAEAIRDMLGWDKNQLATVRRRIRRRIEARFPHGFPA